MPKKKILIFTDWYYPGFMAGGPIQSSFNLITHLQEYYDFSVVSRDTDYTDIVPYKDIKSDEWNILPNGMRVFYFSSKNLSYPAMAKLIQSEDFDIAYLNSMYSPRFTIMPLLILNKMNKHTIIAPRGMLAPTAIAIKSWKKKPFLLWISHSSMIKKIRFHAASEQEAGHIFNVFGKKVEIHVAPNLPGKMPTLGGADGDLHEPIHKRKEPGSLHLVNVSRISPEKNLHYALEVLMHIKGKIRYDIYGPVYDYPYWEKCKDLLAKLPGNIEAEYLGPIAKDSISAALKDVHFLLMPTQGENFGHTILEAMSSGCPVIISDATPWRGLEAAKVGFDIPLENPGDFAVAVNKAVLMDEQEFSIWSERAREFVIKFINDPTLLQKSIDLFQFN